MYSGLDLLGKTILIDGYRGDSEMRVGRVVDVRDVESNPVKLKTSERKMLTRGRWLLKLWDSKRNVTRSYYLAHCETVNVLGWWGRCWHALLCLLTIR